MKLTFTVKKSGRKKLAQTQVERPAGRPRKGVLKRVHINLTLDGELYEYMQRQSKKEPGVHNWSMAAEKGIRDYLKNYRRQKKRRAERLEEDE
jgi:hypothetical protein